MMELKTLCSQCGPNIKIDEDGCCTMCGCDACGKGVEQIAAEIDALKALIARTVESGLLCDPGCCGDDCVCDELREVAKGGVMGGVGLWNECPHGILYRDGQKAECEICERDEEIKRLQTAVDLAKDLLKNRDEEIEYLKRRLAREAP